MPSTCSLRTIRLKKFHSHFLPIALLHVNIPSPFQLKNINNFLPFSSSRSTLSVCKPFLHRRERTDFMLWPSRTRRNADEIMKSGAVVEEAYVYQEETHLTVLKTSLFFAGDGFTAYDSKGELVFRVDSYGPDAGDTGEVVLMDASGRCILTVRRKRPSLHHRWEGFIGEGTEGKKPLFSVRRSSIIGRSSMTVEVYTNPGEEYQIEGSFGCRNCTIYNTEKEAVAEIRRKVDASTNVVLGKDVFVLSLKPGFDGAFAMGLVLVLDQIYGADDDDDIKNGSRVGVDPTSEDPNLSP